MDRRWLSEFLRLLAHDLQNQIGAVDLNLQILPSLLTDEKSLKTATPFFERASLSAGDLIETLTDLQTFAATLAEEKAKPSAPFELVPLVEKAFFDLKGRALTREVSLEVILPPKAYRANGHSDLLSRALKMLTSEAMRTSAPGSLITASFGETPNLQPFVQIETSQEGLFSIDRPTLALVLSKELLSASEVQFSFPDSVRATLLKLICVQAVEYSP